MDNSTIEGNSCNYGGGGGGISSSGATVMVNSLVASNTCPGAGGGIGSGGTLILQGSTISTNTSNSNGGGISNGANLHLNNSTVSGNTGGAWGGGIYSNDTMTLNSSTISNNTSSSNGGGLYRYAGTATVQNTLLADNASSTGPDCSGVIASAGYNLLGDPSGCSFSSSSGDLIDVDPLLAPLEGYPGFQRLQLGSSAIDAGDPGGCAAYLDYPLPYDQRGAPRVGRCDIGAIEMQRLDASLKLAGVSSAPPGAPVTFTISLHNTSGVSVSDVVVTDELPDKLTYIADSLDVTSGSASYENGVVTWEGSVVAGADVTITFGATIDQEALWDSTITNSAEIQADGAILVRIASLKVGGSICGFTKFAGNPVLTAGTNGSWDDVGVWHQDVIEKGGTLMMWYTGADGSNPRQIGLAASINGVDWTKEASNPVITPTEGWEADGISAPSVLYEGGEYKMWYSGADSSGVVRIGYATSSDGITWLKYGSNPVLDVGAADGWEDEDVSAPSVIKDGGIYHMWYTGFDGSTPRIGYATSSDGITWNKDGANPVLDLGEAGDWDWLGVFSPDLIRVGSEYQLWYSGDTLPPSWQTGYAVSSNGTDWDRMGMVIPEGATGSFDSNSADLSAVLLDGATYRIWYSGLNDEGGNSVGYATANTCAGGSYFIYLPLICRDYSGPSACPAFYTDDFSDSGSGWPVWEDDDAKFAYTGGEYQIWVKNPASGWMVTPGAKWRSLRRR